LDFILHTLVILYFNLNAWLLLNTLHDLGKNLICLSFFWGWLRVTVLTTHHPHTFVISNVTTFFPFNRMLVWCPEQYWWNGAHGKSPWKRRFYFNTGMEHDYHYSWISLSVGFFRIVSPSLFIGISRVIV